MTYRPPTDSRYGDVVEPDDVEAGAPARITPLYPIRAIPPAHSRVAV